MTDSGVTEGERWSLGTIPLKFQIGDLTLFKIGLELLSRSAEPNERPLHHGDLPQAPCTAEGTPGFVVWSQPIAGALPKLARFGRHIVYVPRQYNRYSIDLCGTFEEYLAKFSSKSRSTLKRKMKKFTEISGGKIEWRLYKTPDEIAAFLPLAQQLSAKTYQERLLKNGLPTDNYFISQANELAVAGCIRAFLLFVNEKPVSYLYCPEKNGTLYYSYLGYDPDFAASSPGTVLQMLALEAIFAERRHRLFDFTEGEGQHKAFFATGHQLCADVYVLNATSRFVAPVLAHRVAEVGVEVLSKGLDRIGWKRSIRRLIRRTAT